MDDKRIEKDILELKNLIEQSRFTTVITGVKISVSARIGDLKHTNFSLVLQMSSETVLQTMPNRYYQLARKAFLEQTFHIVKE